MNVTDYGERNPATPSQRPTPEQYAAARRYLLANAPDLIDMLLGGDAGVAK